MIDINEFNNYECTGCHTCSEICPKKCITMTADKEGFLYPVVDKEKCIGCNLCEKVCPVISKNETNNNPIAFAAWNKDEAIRAKSSSGGVFTELAQYVIGHGGTVFGAAVNDNIKVEHIGISNIEDLGKLRGSKYVQSRIGNTYSKAKSLLEKGEYVLFSGTPCQIEGLLKYLGHDYDTLITQDIICHGVPSPLVLSKYLEFRQKKLKSKIKNIQFRNKTYGWKNYAFNIELEDGTNDIQKGNENLYINCFLTDMCLRPSCYNCNFKSDIRPSDFTLADFWGIENIIPNIDDDKGISLVFANSDKSKRIFNEIKDALIYKQVDSKAPIKYNQSMVVSTTKHKNRDLFMKTIQKRSFKKALDEAWEVPSLPVRAVMKMKNIMKRFI